jgi:ATP-dependent DNA helicase PIF1
MRVHIYGDQDAGSFANILLQIGNGAIPTSPEDGQIVLPGGSCTVVTSTDNLITSIYPNISQNYVRIQWLCERAILAPKNDMVDFINHKILKTIPSEEKTYRSNDRTQSDEDALQFPTEFLNSLNPPGMPAHVLTLKKGAPVILLRNLDPPKLCNGTRLQIKQLLPHVIEATVLTGQAAGEQVFIPRIPINNEEMGFSFKRVQYPLKLCFAMSINKAQGQSLKYAGLHLENPCFSHGQLYVGCSRVGSSKGLFVLAPNGKTVNVVYPQVL